MRLLDQIALAAVDGGGEKAARQVREATLRYVVDRTASEQCFDLVRNDNGLLDPANLMLRMPAELCWIEWMNEAVPGALSNHRLGALVEAAPDGRSGVITPFWQQHERSAAMAPIQIGFDLDHALDPPPGSALVRRMNNASLPHLLPLFGHMLCHIDPHWAAAQRSGDPFAAVNAIRAQAEATWFNLPFLLAFSALLASRDVVDQQPADLARLNRARTRRGRHALLDHIEVSLRFAAGSAGQAGAVLGPRDAPRLHFVRGHIVSRGGATFWRVPHLRGDPERPILSKTVNVRGAH